MLIAQLSDPHVRPEGVLYQGVVNSNAMFAAAIAHVNALDPRPNLVLLSGDLVDKGTADEYAMLRKLLAVLERPFLVIPGNHDDRDVTQTFSDHAYLPASGPLNYVAEGYRPVRIAALDVTLPGLHHGTVTVAGAQWLEGRAGGQFIAADPDHDASAALQSGVPYLDAYLCRDGGRLAEVVARYPAVERIVCGHVHRFMTIRFGGTTLCTHQHDDGDRPATQAGGAASILRRAAGLFDPSLAAGHRHGHAFQPDRRFPGPFPFA